MGDIIAIFFRKLFVTEQMSDDLVVQLASEIDTCQNPGALQHVEMAVKTVTELLDDSQRADLQEKLDVKRRQLDQV